MSTDTDTPEETPEERRARQTSHLTPFEAGSERTIEAARRGGLARQRKRREKLEAIQRKANLLDVRGDLLEALEMADLLDLTAQDIVARLYNGVIPIESGAQAAQVLKVLREGSQLLRGRETTRSVVINAADVARLQADLAARAERAGVDPDDAVIDVDPDE